MIHRIKHVTKSGADQLYRLTGAPDRDMAAMHVLDRFGGEVVSVEALDDNEPWAFGEQNIGDMVYIVLSQEYGEAIDRDFPAFDNKGRQFGARAQLIDFNYRAPTEDERNRGWMINYADPERVGVRRVTEPKIEYAFRPHALRNGRSYGSSHDAQRFATVEERDAAIEVYFAAAQKRAMKNKARAA